MRKHTLLALLIALLPAVAAAQTPAPAPAAPDTTATKRIGPPVQRIATATALSTERLGIVMSVRELADGRVLVNDMMRRRVMLLDTSMKLADVVLDSLSSSANYYGSRNGTLIPFRGDTTFFMDPASYSIVVLDPAGKIVRVRSVWRVEDMQYLSSAFGNYGWPGADAQGRIIYRIQARPAPPKVRPPAGIPYFPDEPDSAFLVAVHLDTRKLDTLATIRTPPQEYRIRQTTDRGFTVDQIVNPLPRTDEWALLPDGTLAIVRGVDYRVEYIHPDGTKTSSGKLPFDWVRMSDEDKQRLVDSVKTAAMRNNASQYVSSMIQWVNQYNRSYPKNFTVPEGFTLRPGFPKDWILPPGVKFPPNYIYACPPGTDPPPPTAGMPSCFPAPVSFSTGNTPPPPTQRPVIVTEAERLPDYRPPFPPGSVRADMEGNLWIRTNPMKPTPGGPVFDIVSPKGELVNRIQLLPGYSIVGFGKGKIVYLTTRDATGMHVARVRLK